jgi:four helix bundle protein
MPQFEQLEVWKRACRLSVLLYENLESCKIYSYKDQVTRAGLSVASNIAEGFERGSKQELIRFLQIAKGSCGEVRTQLYIGIEAGLLGREIGFQLIDEALQISKMLAGLIKHKRTT